LNAKVSLVHAGSLFNEELRTSHLSAFEGNFHFFLKAIEFIGECFLGIFSEFADNVLFLNFFGILICFDKSFLQQVENDARVIGKL
jgi:hypothetical protein